MYKPFSHQFNVDRTNLRKDYPPFLQAPVLAWAEQILSTRGILISGIALNTTFIHQMGLDFHNEYPSGWGDFKRRLMADPEFMTEFLNYLLYKYGNVSRVVNLEKILSQGASAYKAIAEEYDHELANGISTKAHKCFLQYRVDEAVQEQAASVTRESQLLLEAWNECYSISSDDEKVVSKCCDALEALFKERYFPKDPKPQLGKFVNAFEKGEAKLVYSGANLIDRSSQITDLLKQFPNIRGQHTAGKGRVPSHDEAVFVLQATIFIFSLHMST